jgi:hypothetical protein
MWRKSNLVQARNQPLCRVIPRHSFCTVRLRNSENEETQFFEMLGAFKAAIAPWYNAYLKKNSEKM